MKSKYIFERKDDYLNFTISGEYVRDEFETYLHTIKNKCEIDKIYKVILNCLNVKGTDISIAERFFLGKT